MYINIQGVPNIYIYFIFKYNINFKRVLKAVVDIFVTINRLDFNIVRRVSSVTF